MEKEKHLNPEEESKELENQNEERDELPTGFPDEKDFNRFLGCGG